MCVFGKPWRGVAQQWRSCCGRSGSRGSNSTPSHRVSRLQEVASWETAKLCKGSHEKEELIKIDETLWMVKGEKNAVAGKKLK